MAGRNPPRIIARIAKMYTFLCLMISFVLLQGLGISLAFLSFYSREKSTSLTMTAAITRALAKALTPMLHLDLALVLLPVCNPVISLFRKVFGRQVTAESCTRVHELIMWSMAALSITHATSHWISFEHFVKTKGLGNEVLLRVGFTTGVGWSGHVLLLTLLSLSIASLISKKLPRFLTRFKYGTTYWIPFFLLWSVHESYRLPIKDLSGQSTSTFNAFWSYWIVGASVYLIETVFTTMRPRHKV